MGTGPVVAVGNDLHGVHGGAQRLHDGDDAVCVLVRPLLLVGDLQGGVMRPVELLQPHVDLLDAGQELLQQLFLGRHVGTRAGRLDGGDGAGDLAA